MCGKRVERLCGLGPSLKYVLATDPYIQSMKQQVSQCLQTNFTSVNAYIEHFKFVHNFFVEDKHLDVSLLTEETGKFYVTFLLFEINEQRFKNLNGNAPLCHMLMDDTISQTIERRKGGKYGSLYFLYNFCMLLPLLDMRDCALIFSTNPIYVIVLPFEN